MHNRLSLCVSWRLSSALVLMSFVLLAGMPGCSSKPKAVDPSGKSLSRTDEQIFLGDTIERNYDPHVIIKRAEAFYDREEYPEAVVELQHFLELHRAHRLASYAQFRLGEAYLQQARSVDRDPEPVLRAESVFQKLRKDFPNSRYDAQAVTRIRDCHEWLAKSHMFVGQFYYRRGAYLAAAHRYQAVLNEFPDMGVAPEAQYELARTYEALGAEEWAREQLTNLAQRYPNSDMTGAAKRLLADLGGPLSSTQVASVGTVPSAAPATPAVSDESQSASRVLATGTPSPGRDRQTGSSPTALSDAAPSLGTSPTTCRLGAWC